MPNHSRSVIVVDDEPSLLRAMTRLLRDAGHSVRAFASAHEALAEIERSPPEVVVTDARMPEMDGLALARALFDAVLEKPFEQRQLARAIDAATPLRSTRVDRRE